MLKDDGLKRSHVESNKGHIYDENTNEYEDTMSNNGDSVKDLSPVGVKRKHYDEMDGKQAAFDYMKNFEGIRARNFEEMQQNNDPNKHPRLMGGGGGGGVDYRGMMNSGVGVGDPTKLNVEDSVGESNVNYASSEDLNQTNSSETGEKSGSDDEGNNGKSHLF